jgi:hypothetical protein
MKSYAMILPDSTVRGVCVWDGVTPWHPPPEVDIVLELLPGERCGPGWVYDMSGNPRFTPPPQGA